MEDLTGKNQSGCRAYAEDAEFIREFVPPSAIQTLTNEFIAVTVIRTAFARINIKIIFQADYPNTLPGVELSSPTLPFALLRFKEKECLDQAKEAREEFVKKGEGGIHGLVPAIYEHVYSFIQNNLFIPCWKEMKQLVTLCAAASESESVSETEKVEVKKETSTDDKNKKSFVLACDEKRGIINMKLKVGNYKQTIVITVPEDYPENGVKVSICISFTFTFTFIFTCPNPYINNRGED